MILDIPRVPYQVIDISPIHRIGCQEITSFSGTPIRIYGAV